MESKTEPPAKKSHVAWIWAALIIGWLFFLLPIPGISLILGGLFVIASLALSLIAINNGNKKAGMIPLATNVAGSPIAYIIGLIIFSAIVDVIHKAPEPDVHTAQAVASSEALDVPVQSAEEAESRSQSADHEKTVESGPEAHEQVAAFDFTAEEYTDRLNQRFSSIGSDLRGRLGDVTEGPSVNTFVITIATNQSIIVASNKNNNRVTEVTAITTGDGSTKSGAEALIVGINAISVCAHESEHKSIAKMVLDLVEEAIQGEDAKYRDFKNMRISIINSNVVGTWFTVKPLSPKG